MSLYIDNWSVVDTEHVACVHMVEGTGPNDGHYALAYFLVHGNKLRQIFVDYPDKPTRDAAFKTLAALMGQEMEEDEEGGEL